MPRKPNDIHPGLGINAGSPDETKRDHCIRCGTCCAGGGPALHVEDLELVRAAAIDLSDLYTIRKGEMALDNVSGKGCVLDAEIIKIRSGQGSAACIFYDVDLRACGIYASRPLECRVMKCWDTAKIVALYQKDRVSRKDILGRAREVMDLVSAHERKCSYGAIAGFAEKRAAGDYEAANALSEMIAFDESVRSSVSSKMDNGEKIVDFLFGRPLRVTIPRQFGIKITSRRM
ncbi:MAG: YkgJ family cysteine cluster protein [Deltaproteobacteria bacterium]|nr:YkgJ family cysteine cluster protein [Deltaproteobacteria bacterium]